MKKNLPLFFVAVVLSSCAGKKEAETSPIPASELSAPKTEFIGDPCEYAQRAFLRSHQEYGEDPTSLILRDKQTQSRKAMEAICKTDEDETPETWACAEGHSCR